jgi:hypothetical protein
MEIKFKNKSTILLLLMTVIYFFLNFPLLTTAEGLIFRPQIGIPPELKVGEEYPVGAKTLGNYIKSFYQWSITAVAILAVIMIMISGLQWIFSAGNPPAIAKAKDQMISAILGLILVLICIPLLKMINPALVRLSTFEIPEIIRSSVCRHRWPSLRDSGAEWFLSEEGNCKKILVKGQLQFYTLFDKSDALCSYVEEDAPNYLMSVEIGRGNLTSGCECYKKEGSGNWQAIYSEFECPEYKRSPVKGVLGETGPFCQVNFLDGNFSILDKFPTEEIKKFVGDNQNITIMCHLYMHARFSCSDGESFDVLQVTPRGIKDKLGIIIQYKKKEGFKCFYP